MDKIAPPPGPSPIGSLRRWVWVVGAIVAGFILLLLLSLVPRFIVLYQLYWSRDGIQRLFYEDLGVSKSWAEFFGVVGSFAYALAWVPLLFWTYRVLAWRFNARQLAVAFACWVFVYGHVPLTHVLLGTDACFNQRTGAPMKWYVESANGDLTLFDSGGFDPVTRAEKRAVTPEICGLFQKQKLNGRPHKITTNVQDIEYFDPNNGRARVWYSKGTDGRYELFDSSGFDPATSEQLRPVTKEIVSEIMTRAASDTDERRLREETRHNQEAKVARQQAEEMTRTKSLPALTPASECDTTWSDPFTVNVAPTLLLIPGVDCQLTFTVITGKVRLEGSNGYMDFGPDGLTAKMIGPNWKAMTIRALAPNTQIVRRFCPEGTTRWENGRCV